MSYPDDPGYRDTDTSAAGADCIAPVAAKLQAECFAAIFKAGADGLTGDELAARLGWPKWRVRPRTSELRANGHIVDSGLRRLSEAGVASIVWVAPRALEKAA